MAKKVASIARAESIGSNVERIRDILFGTQMQEYEQRFVEQNEVIEKLKATLEERLKEFENRQKEELKKTTRRVEEVLRELGGKIDDLARELRLADESTRETLEKRLDELNRTSGEQLEELFSHKVDRQELVRVFMDFVNAAPR